MIKIAIVEDCDEDAAMLMEHIQRYSNESGCGFEVNRIVTALDFASEYRPIYDLIFFDIMMPGMNGIEAARRIREVDRSVVLAFITNMAQYAIEGYEVEASAYILKPIAYTVFREKMMKLVKLSQKAHKKVPLLVGDNFDRRIRIFASEVYYILKDRNYVYFYAANGVYKKREELKLTLPKLKGTPFVQINSGCCVNLDYLDEILLKSVKIKGEEFPIARARRKTFVESYMSYLNGDFNGEDQSQ
ncbi:MAG: LytTR family DNA-binding domain-containing protein [Ruminococcus flavefaciens]|nr:LytTR family DNA-binding domain-containing protein [Ruminococcus flavefaciens]